MKLKAPLIFSSMRIFGVYQPEKIELLRLWIRSWKTRGWEPRLISERDIRRHRSFIDAMFAKGGAFFTFCDVINFSFDLKTFEEMQLLKETPVEYLYAKKLSGIELTGKNFKSPGWEISRLVKCSGMTELQVLTCGRRIF